MKIVIFALILALVGLVSCRSTPPNQNSNSSDSSIVSGASREVDKVLSLAKIPRIENVPLDNRDVEIRVWRGFGTSPMQGVIFSRRNGVYAATHLKADDYYAPTNVTVSILDPPRTGWANFWGNVLEDPIASLLESKADCFDSGQLDGIGYLLERKSGNGYASKFVSESRCHEIARIEDVAMMIAAEFGPGVEQCRGSEWLPCLYEPGKVPAANVGGNSIRPSP